jgi:hypothetical protein
MGDGRRLTLEQKGVVQRSGGHGGREGRGGEVLGGSPAQGSCRGCRSREVWVVARWIAVVGGGAAR